MKFQENISLSKYSNYKIGGRARFFCEPKNEREVTMAVAKAGEMKLPIFVLGGGTNLLFRDSGFSGLVIKPAIAKISMGKPTAASKTVSVGAGVSMAELLKYATDKSLSGLEWAGGLPGTVGGAIRGNAGCFGGEIKDVIQSVRSFDVKKMKVIERSARECKLAYRDSIFKKSGAHGAANEIILSATFALAKGDRRLIAKSVAEKIAYRTKHHPLEYPNIGSIFKNIPLAEIHTEASSKYKAALAAQSLAYRGSEFSVKVDPFPVISAAKLISESGLRGVSFGGAMISAKHPNFIVNVLGAEAGDVKALMALAQANVKKKFGVSLEPEVQVV
jgi:UDP-N-acetylmuramate dehydrogenase